MNRRIGEPEGTQEDTGFKQEYREEREGSMKTGLNKRTGESEGTQEKINFFKRLLRLCVPRKDEKLALLQ